MINGIGEVFKYINTLPEAAVYAFIDEDSKSVYIAHSTKFKQGIFSNSNLERADKFKLEFFECPADPVYKLVIAEKIRMQYINRGYKVTNQTTPFIRFRAILKFGTMLGKATIVLVSPKGKRRVVGVFGKLSEAQAFYSEFYAGGVVGDIVYSSNGFTRDYVYKHESAQGSQLIVESNERSE